MKRIKLWTLALAISANCFGSTDQQVEQFSITTLNVDGLPQKILMFNVNADGPGSHGTVRIGKYLTKKSADLVFVQEDFNYNRELTAMLEDNYQTDDWSGDVGLEGHTIDFLHLQNHRYECDGLMGFWKKGISVTASQRTPWNAGFGKFSHANDLLVTKGFRRHEVTLPGGSRIVVYNMHMDAEDDADTEVGNATGDRTARQQQWLQLREAIMEQLDDRPVIVVGDLNSFYYRDPVKELFIDAINASGRATVGDVWSELENQGAFPQYDATNNVRDDKEEGHNGESLDKILYIIPTGGQSVKPISYSRDVTDYRYDGQPLGDHFPVTATFQVNSKTTTAIEQLDADDAPTDYFNLSGQRVGKPATSGLYIERNGKAAHKRIIKK